MMKKLFQRALSFLLALLSVITLLPLAELPVASQAADVRPNQTVYISNAEKSQKTPQSYGVARTYDDVYAIVDDYYKTVGKNAYWNVSVRGESESVLNKLKKQYPYLNGLSATGTAYLEVLPLTAAVSSKACASYRVNGNNAKHYANKKVNDEPGCSSNVYKGEVHGGEAQCAGFAEYMAYIVFKDKAKIGTGCYKKISGKAIKNYKIKPGDILRIKSNSGAAAGHHSVFVYAVNGSKLSIIECNNPSGSCKITTRTITVGSSDFHGSCSTCAIYSSPVAGVEKVESWSTNVEVVLNTVSNLYSEANASADLATENPFAAGTAGLANKIQKNADGEYWYYVTVGSVAGWVYGGNCDVKGLGPKTTSVSNDFTYLSKYNSSGSVTLQGKIYSLNSTIVNVTGAIRDGEGNTVKNKKGVKQEVSFDWCASSYSLQKGPINSLLTPKKLKAGLYQYTIDVDIMVKTTDGKNLNEMIQRVRVVDDWFEYYNKKTAGIALTFDLNGGNYAQSSKLEKLVYKDKPVGELPVPKKVGEEFVGWYTAKTDGTQITEDSIVSKNTTLYARWKTQDKSYSVQFLPNGGKGEMTVQNFYIGSSGNLSANAFQKEGYVFNGWNTAADGSGTAYTDGQTVRDLTTKDKHVVSLYAQWKPVEKTYTIRYNGNGGVGTMPITKLSVGTPGELSRNAYRKDACIFLGWNTAADGSGTAYADRQEVLDVTTEDKSVVTLYAQWREMTEAEYLKNCTRYASHMKLTATTGQIMTRPVKTGTVGRQLTAGETLVSTALYQNPAGEYWYQVRADRDGKTGYVYAGNAKNNGIANKTVTFRASLAKYDIPKGEKCDITGSVSAQYNILYEVTGKLNDADAATPEQTATTRSGFNSLAGTAINNLAFGRLSRGKGTLVLTAKLRSAYSTGTALLWEEYTTEKHTVEFTILGEHPVTYDPNTTDEVTGMPAQQTKTDGNDLTLAGEIPARAGYTFLGWATTADAAEVAYQPGAKYTEDAPLVLYAIWQQNTGESITYTVSYTTDKPFYSLPESQTKRQGEPLVLSDWIPTSQYYTFTGWAAQIDGQQLVFQPGDTFALDANVTFTALYKVTSYLYDAVNNTYWELGESFRQVDAFDTSEMCHITLGVNYSQEVLEQNPFGDWWLAFEKLTSWDTVTVGTRDGKLDFYVSPGTWLTIIGQINCDYTFEQSEDITVNAQMLVRHANGGVLDPSNPEVECNYSMYWVGYPQFGEVFPTMTREGYTLMGWNTDPTSSEVIYAPDATWEQLDPAHVHCYAVWQPNE